LCEYIALIHQSEKILDGKLSEIKKAYKNNMFKVGLEVKNAEGLLKELSNKFKVISSKINPLDNQLDFTVQLPTNDSSEMLAFLTNRANVNGFVETIPSANEIFIQTIQSKDANE
jgi:ABC-2 type transport system ATP-binding protein